MKSKVISILIILPALWGAGGALAQSPECERQYGCFVERQYWDFLNRPAEEGGYIYYLDRLCSGVMTPEIVVSSFISSPEFAAHNGFVARCYFGIFNNNSAVSYDDPNYRIPDYGGLQYWGDVMEGVIDGGDRRGNRRRRDRRLARHVF